MVKNSPETSLRYIGLGDTSGYGVAAAALVRALRDAGAVVVWEPMLPGGALGMGYAPAASPDAGPVDLRPLRDNERRCDDVVIHFVPEYYPYFIERERRRSVRRIIGHTVWETDRLPAHWPALINQLDAVIVPTHWNREVFHASGVVIPIEVVPHLPRPIQPATAMDHASLCGRLPDFGRRFVFYTLSTWLERKAIGPLVAAFAQAFGNDDPVALVIKTTPFDYERVRRDPGHEGQPVPVLPQFEAMIGRAVLRHGRLPPPIHLLTDELPDGEILALHERGDCFVSLCRAEGWGLGAFEAACIAKPVIITGWGGPTAYLSADTAHLVEWTPASVAPGEANASYTGDQNWAEPDLASAVKALRAVLSDPQEAMRQASRAAQSIRRDIVPARVVHDLLHWIATVAPGASAAPDGWESAQPPPSEPVVTCVPPPVPTPPVRHGARRCRVRRWRDAIGLALSGWRR